MPSEHPVPSWKAWSEDCLGCGGPIYVHSVAPGNWYADNDPGVCLRCGVAVATACDAESCAELTYEWEW